MKILAESADYVMVTCQSGHFSEHLYQPIHRFSLAVIIEYAAPAEVAEHATETIGAHLVIAVDADQIVLSTEAATCIAVDV